MTNTEFINKIGPMIKKQADARGYSCPSAMIAQCCHESGFGESKLAKDYHNYFGMKCGSKWRGKSTNMRTLEEYTPNKMTSIRANFRVYDSMEDGVEGYFNFISMPRYKNLINKQNPLDYIQELKDRNYATGSNYVEHVFKLVEQYQLWRYDCEDMDGECEFKIGLYEVTAGGLNVRRGPGKCYPKKKHSELTLDAQAHSSSAGYLYNKTRINVKSVYVLPEGIWGEIPSGFVCLSNYSKDFVKPVSSDDTPDYTPNLTINKLVRQAQNWIGLSESDGSHRVIIDSYNSHKPLPRGYKVKYTDAWCATFVSACAIESNLDNLIPLECSCNKMIDLYKRKGWFIEDDSIVPKSGDIIFYDWNDTGRGDCLGSSEHVGIVESVVNNKITVIEGNKHDRVERRVIDVNGRYIRGFGCPQY